MKKKLLICISVILTLCVSVFTACGKTEKTPLATPSLTINENVVSWEEVANATGYEVYINGTLKQSVTQTTYTITEAQNGTYEIKVKALSGDSEKYTDSKLSNGVEYIVSGPIKLAAPVVGVLGSLISWEEVANASSYEVYIDDVLKETVSNTYCEFTDLEIGEYTVKVIAKSNNTELYIDSAPSSTVTYRVIKQFVRIEKVSDPTVTTYYLDENKNLDLSGLEVTGIFQNADNETITLTEENIVSAYDMKVPGRYELELEYTGENGVSSSVVVRIFIKERTKEDISEYSVIKNQLTETNYTVSSGVATSAFTMKGEEIQVTNDGTKTYATANQLKEGETLLKVGEEFVLVIVARFVSSVEDFNAIINEPNGYYLLINDLDFSEKTCTPIGRAPVNEDCSLNITGNGGTAFNGTFNGDGHIIKNFSYNSATDEKWYEAKAYGVGLFGYIGETGKVCNLILRSVSIKGGAYTSFVAGCNLGTIENVMIEDNCSLHNQYGAGAVISAYNYGTVKNVVSYVDKCSYAYGDGQQAINIVRKEDDYTDNSGINGYVGDTTDLTSVLGGGWTYINGYGTVLANDDYKKVLSADTTWYNGNEVKISFWQKNMEEVYFSVWGTGASDVTTVLKYKSFDSDTCTYTFTIEVELTVGDSHRVGVGVAGKGYVELFDVIVGEEI